MKKEIRIWAVVFWLLVWQLASMAIGSDILLVSPVTVLITLGRMVREASFWASIWFSLKRIFGGFLLGLLAGAALAGLSARFRFVRELMTPFMLTIRTVPVASFIILALIWFSSRNLSVLISFLMVLPILYTGILQGIEERDRDMLEMAQVFHVSRMRRFLMIDLPSVYPFLYASCKTALGLSWKSGIAAEVIGMPKGSIGEHLQKAKVYLDTPELFAWTVVIVLVSLACEKLVLLLMDRQMKQLYRWKG